MITRGNKDKCYYCGKEEVCTKDHVYPQSKLHKLHENIETVWACKFCQALKSDTMPLDFLSYVNSHPCLTAEAKRRYHVSIETLLDKITFRNVKKVLPLPRGKKRTKKGQWGRTPRSRTKMDIRPENDKDSLKLG
jgi:hypothetical protein